MSKLADLVILGATGTYCPGTTGRQATRFLAAHPERSREWTVALAARSKEKLQKSTSEPPPPQDIPLVTLDVTDEEAVNELVKQTKVFLNTAGPYIKLGVPVVKACVRNGVHYVDLAGDAHFIQHLIRECHYNATKTGSVVVNACAFYSVPSDICVFVANKALKSKDKTLQVASSTSAVTLSGIMSSGTLETMILVRTLPEAIQRDMARQYCLSPVVGPSYPRNRVVYRLYEPQSQRTIVGGGGFTADNNRFVVHRSWGLPEQDAMGNRSSLGKREARCGPSLIYNEFLETGGTLSALMVSVGVAFFWWSLAFAPVSAAVFDYELPGGVPISDSPVPLALQETSAWRRRRLESGNFKIVNVTTSAPTAAYPNGVKVTTTFSGKGDPGYLLSPTFMAECGLVLLDRDSLPELAKRGGVLTPATAGGNALLVGMLSSSASKKTKGSICSAK
ncbi:saccharopine dehydrogenase [Moniliophthora roreri]|nr:saccharopine dehydrogenase [Moniliophthora roreri]